MIAPGSGCATLDLGDGQALLVHDGTPPAHGRRGTWHQVVRPIAPPGGLVVEVPHRRVLWSDVLGGAFPAPVTDVSLIGDDDLRAAIAERPRPLVADEVRHLTAIAPRVLASPTAPLARGRGVDRVLRLLADTPERPSTVVADLMDRLGPPPWTAPRSPS